MFDMLVRLYDLPSLSEAIVQQKHIGVVIRRAIAPEKYLITEWLGRHFRKSRISECEVAFAQQPVACFLAITDAEAVGFACYGVTKRGFFGPMGVISAARKRGTGRALLLACLHSMWTEGYGYAIVGGVGPAKFYEKTVGAVKIKGSTPGIYADRLKKPEND